MQSAKTIMNYGKMISFGDISVYQPSTENYGIIKEKVAQLNDEDYKIEFNFNNSVDKDLNKRRNSI